MSHREMREDGVQGLVEELIPMLPGHETFPARKELIEGARAEHARIVRRWMAARICEWRWDDADEYWKTDCGRAFCLIDGTPKDNDYTYCPGCGRLIIEVRGEE